MDELIFFSHQAKFTQHFICDEQRHFHPFTLCRVNGQFLCHSGPAMQIHHGAVGGRGCVEGKLCSCEIHLFGCCGDKGGDGHRNLFPLAVCLPGSFLHGREDHFLHISNTMEWMRMESVAQFPGEFCQTRINSCNVNGDVWKLNGSRVEKWRHQRDLVMLAATIQLCSVLPAIPKRADDFDLLAQFPCDRLRPRLTKPPLDMRLDLGAEPQNEASL